MLYTYSCHQYFCKPITCYHPMIWTFGQNFDFNLGRDHEKNSYERRDYESVDKNESIKDHVPKNDERKNSGIIAVRKIPLVSSDSDYFHDIIEEF